MRTIYNDNEAKVEERKKGCIHPNYVPPKETMNYITPIEDKNIKSNEINN